MNKDQGKPSERIDKILLTSPYVNYPDGETKHSADVRREIDNLHDRLVSAEAELQELKFSLSNGDYLPKSPTQEDGNMDSWKCEIKLGKEPLKEVFRVLPAYQTISKERKLRVLTSIFEWVKKELESL